MASRKTKSSAPPQSAFVALWPWLALALVLLLFSCARLHMASFPLERDEGEYAYAGQLLLQGIPPYKLAYNMKLPGTYVWYAATMAVFGQSALGVHIGLLLANLGAITLVFLLARRLFSNAVAVVSCATYAMMSTSHTVMGMAAHASHLVVLFALAGIFLLLKAMDSGRALTFFWSGLLLGSSFLMKQPGLSFAMFAAFWLLWNELKNRPIHWKRCLQRESLLAVGVAVPFLCACVGLFLAGVFEKFWFWTFTYTQAYGARVPLKNGLLLLRDYFRDDVGPVLPLWIFGAVGVVFLLFQTQARRNAVFLGSFFVFSTLAVAAGLYFRPHYFVMVLPAVALLVGAAVAGAYDQLTPLTRSKWVRSIPAVVFFAGWCWTFSFHVPLFFRMTKDEAPFVLYPGNPFKETKEIGDYIRENSTTTDTVAVLGSEPQIYFYSKRHSASAYIYMYPLMETHPFVQEMQREAIADITETQPRFLVIVSVPFSWARLQESDPTILNWSSSYIAQHYDLVRGVAVEEFETPADANEPAGKILLYERKKNGS